MAYTIDAIDSLCKLAVLSTTFYSANVLERVATQALREIASDHGRLNSLLWSDCDGSLATEGEGEVNICKLEEGWKPQTGN